MRGILAAATAAFVCFAGSAAIAAEFDAGAAHGSFIEAFNNDDWDSLRNLLADDVTFHRANASEVFVGPDAVMEMFSGTVGAQDQWNVKFAMLDSTDQFTGKDGRVVERGDFAVTAGADDSSCYRGSYMMTWAPQTDDTWKLQMLAWQDVETELANCQS